ncbi:MAG: hypothetical protein NC223_08670, partial [Butyrivibrio sp.]|nr:hypothetical protein [Butyrivibrio sp.]
TVKTNKLKQGNYPFIVYEWQYKGVLPNSELEVITKTDIDSKTMLQLMYNAQDCEEADLTESTNLEELHFAKWKVAKEKYLLEAEQSIRFKMSSLVASQQGQIRAIQNILSKATDERIIKMKKAQLERLKQSFIEKQEKLKTEIEKCDIISTKLVVGTLRVEN